MNIRYCVKVLIFWNFLKLPKPAIIQESFYDTLRFSSVHWTSLQCITLHIAHSYIKPISHWCPPLFIPSQFVTIHNYEP